MIENLKRRTGIRVRIHGTALISSMDLGGEEFTCSLDDISTSGCQCRIALDNASDADVNAWKKILSSGRIFSLKFVQPKEFNGLEIQEAEILWVRERPPAALIFGVKHLAVTAEQTQILSNTLTKLSSNKLRVKSADESGQNSAVTGTPDAATAPVATATAVPVATAAPVPTAPLAPAVPVAKVAAPHPTSGGNGGGAAKPLGKAARPAPPPAAAADDVANRQERVASGYPVTFYFGNTAGKRLHKTAMAGRVTNFSEGGFLIEGDEPGFCEASDLLKNILMHAAIRTPESEFNATLTVLSVRPADTPGRLFYGVKIVQMAEDDLLRLRALYERDSRPTNKYTRQMRDKNVAELELASLREHASRASSALNELQRSLEAARKTQVKMLPDRPPVVEGYELAALYESCVELSGDLYHFLEVRPGYTGLLIGDVAGHGVEAAMVMAATLRCFAARCKDVASSAAVLTEVNNDLHNNLRRGMFVSAFYAVLEHKTGKLTYSRAGHNPAMLFTPSEGMRSLDSNGLALGIAGDVKFSSTIEERQITLPPDALLALYTDGIPEAENADREQFGMDRLCSLLKDNVTLPSATILQKVQEGLSAHTVGQAVADDQTLVILKTAKTR